MRLIVTIDTEEEFDYSKPFTTDQHSTHNIELHHQHMMDFYIQNDVQPVMVVSYPVLQDDHTVSLLKSVFDKKQIVIGSHLHPWVTPPYKEELSGLILMLVIYLMILKKKNCVF